ncbi:ApaG domain-containing protein [Commensalibacter oyaizuii]|uniref:ApaG domain n=1 Tax=Commensalibacter oyaizuii TaxID=3043873 RepID=A0ABT6Q2D1_9PROT|nr:ApaG domain [Commensalibacter sp. TBRC 16381]MDI2091277.1 ApaG domain [Commensalibacter sp. TBRC 16381]
MNNEYTPLLFSPISHASTEQYQKLHGTKQFFEVTTHDVRIAIYPFWLSDFSYPQRSLYSWGYHVRVENHRRETIHILKKDWFVIKSNGSKEPLDNALRIKHRPFIKSGEACDFTTSLTLDTPSNIIKGSYTFTNDKKAELLIPIPTFNLDNPNDFSPIH